jgi:hypothetical protein
MNAVGVETLVIDRLLYGSDGLAEVRGIEKAIASGVQRTHDCLCFSSTQDALHYERIGDDETGELHLLAKEIGQNGA